MLRTLTLLSSLLLLGACGGGDETASTGGDAPDERPVIALVMKSLANEFFVTMREGAEAHHAAHDGEYDLVVNGTRNESELSQQVALVEQMISAGVDAVVIAPADSRALVPVLARAQRAGVVVVNIDNKLDDETLRQAGIAVPFVGPDNRAGARMVGEVLARHLQPGDAVAILEGVPTAFNAQQRRLGFEDAMNAAGMRVVAVQSGQWEQAVGNTVATGILNAHPDLRGILASNDQMALGAATAIRQAGREGEVLIAGFDNIPAAQAMVRDGRILATADQHADQLAVYGIEYALQLLRGGETPQDRQTPVDLVTADSLR
ncbi:MAG TPA: sugar ABC transporter substrate-binding protein [Rubricoccaceae bacterium]|nr:sugar ABC transporter substrate-binding protein [Rubricoccaceae bacterium]